MYIRTCTCLYTYMNLNIHVHVYLIVHFCVMFMYVYIYMCMFTYLLKCMFVYMLKFMFMCMYCTCKYTFTRTSASPCTKTCWRYINKHVAFMFIFIIMYYLETRARSYSRYMEDKQGGSTRSERSQGGGGPHAPCILQLKTTYMLTPLLSAYCMLFTYFPRGDHGPLFLHALTSQATCD